MDYGKQFQILNSEIIGCIENIQKDLPDIPIIGKFAKKNSVMNRNTSISLGSYFDNFIQGRISQGRYKNASEVVRAGLRLLEEEENKTLALKEAIKIGEESGLASDFESISHLEKIKKIRNLNVEL